MKNNMNHNMVQDLCYIALFATLIIVCSQFEIPLPGGVPMTLQTLIIPIAGIVLGARRGTIATWSTRIRRLFRRHQQTGRHDRRVPALLPDHGLVRGYVQ